MNRTTVGSTKLICTEITTNMHAHSIQKRHGRWAGQRKAWWSNKTVIRSPWIVDLCKLASNVLLCSLGPLVSSSFVLCHMAFTISFSTSTQSCCVARGGVPNRLVIEQKSWPVLHRHRCGCSCPSRVWVSVSAKKKGASQIPLKIWQRCLARLGKKRNMGVQVATVLSPDRPKLSSTWVN
jgi:hypothetical protein